MNESSREFQKYATKHLGIGSLSLHNFNKAMMPTSIMNPVGMTPNIIEERQMNVIAMDVFSRLMADRIIFLGLPIDDMIANIVVAQLLFLQSADTKKDIQIYINSPGGSVYAGLGIYDTMQHITPNVATINTGLAASMAFVLMIAGEKGMRQSLPHAKFMQHQPLGGAQGQASDIEIAANQIKNAKKELYDIISYHTGQSYDKILADADRDYWMSASEAKDYGCVDVVLKARNKNKK